MGGNSPGGNSPGGNSPGWNSPGGYSPRTIFNNLESFSISKINEQNFPIVFLGFYI